METSADKARAWAFALLLHVVVFALMFVGLLWNRSVQVPSVSGSVVEAVLVAAPPPPSAPSRSETAPTPAAPPPQPREAPRPQQSPEPPQMQPQTEPERPDTVEQERIARLAEQQQAQERQRREQEERRRREQVLLDQQREQEEAERRQRLSEMQQQREQQLADIRRQREAAEQRRHEAQERLSELERQREQQLADRATEPREAPPQPRIGNEGIDDSLLGRYTVAIQQAVERNWIRPETIRPGVPCQIRIVQIPGGEVLSATVQPSCPYDDLGRRSVEAAVLRAQPLPYAGFESVFRREIIFTFRAPEG